MLEKSIFLYKQSLIILFSFTLNFIRCDNDDCWVKFDAREHFDVMDEIDDRYADVRQNFQAAVGGNKLDKDMLVVMLKTRGIAERAMHKAEGDQSQIPEGINLGGSCMMRMPNAVLFFHRMKLRNNTRFRVVNLESNLTTLELKANLLLNDLHLFGSYDISYTMEDSSQLLYYPSFGEVQILLKNVSYKVDGHYRLLHNRLNLEMVTSDIFVDGALIMYNDRNSSVSMSLEIKNIEPFTERLKVDLDKWIKDYFNDYLAYFVVAEDNEFEKYNQEKTTALNTYTDKVIDIIKNKIHKIEAQAVQLPTFTIKIQNGADIKLRDGVLRGLDSIYRRSVATGGKQDKVRRVSAVVGFSNLKLLYRYDTIVNSGSPPVTGVLTLTADDLTALMELDLMEHETADLSFKYLEQTKPECLTVEGSANRMISNFKYVLERHVVAIMSNSLMHNINMLGTLDKCVPLFASYRERTVEQKDMDYSAGPNNNINSEDAGDKKQTNDSRAADDDMKSNLEHPEDVNAGEDIEKKSQEVNEIKGDSDKSMDVADTTTPAEKVLIGDGDEKIERSNKRKHMKREGKSKTLKKQMKNVKKSSKLSKVKY